MPSIPISCKTAAFNEDVGNADIFRFVVVVSVVFVFNYPAFSMSLLLSLPSLLLLFYIPCKTGL